MDDVRVYRVAFHFADGTAKIFDNDDAYWGTLQTLIKTMQIAIDAYNREYKRVIKWEVAEID
jgi:hypothetical protein